jgi:hypothetical protein
MTDAAKIAETCLAPWNERDANKRTALLKANWQHNATYADPLTAAAGADEISAAIGGVQAQFPNFRFTLIGKPQGVGDNVRFSWALGPGDYVDAPVEGTDFVQLADGKPAAITGFLDKMPPM